VTWAQVHHKRLPTVHTFYREARNYTR
jgi:hypothetical protein